MQDSRRCPIKGCNIVGLAVNEPVCREHWMLLARPLRITITGLWHGNGEGGRPKPGYAEAVANAIAQITEAEKKKRRERRAPA